MTLAYPALMGLAVLTGFLVSQRSQERLPLSAQQKLGLALGAFCGGMIGAKLPFVVADWNGFLDGSAWLDSGKTLVLGLVGGYFGVEIAKWAMHVRLKTGDSFAAPVAAAIAVGRLACFSAGCCRGTPTGLPWGIDFGDGQCCHPTQLYEFIFHSSAAFALTALQRHHRFRGNLIKLYIISYLLFRFATEFIRPEPRYWLDLTLYQWAAVALAPLFIFLWVRDTFRGAPCPISFHKWSG